MRLQKHNSTSKHLVVLTALLFASKLPACAQSAVPPPSPSPSEASSSVQPADSASAPSSAPGAIEIDRVVAVVNGELILESDVNEERRFAAFQPYSNPSTTFSRADAINRLIDRTLILQQAGEQAAAAISDAALDADILELRKAVLACKAYHCETDAGWQTFLADHGFTEQEFRGRWRDRMETLGFIEERFRMGIRINPSEIADYYQKSLLPEYAERNVTPPKLDTIHDRIEEILLQQQVGKLLDDWLKTLRASGNVRMVKPGEVAP
jgi:peptidyl-prolyl cis-trans isomerase SurA